MVVNTSCSCTCLKSGYIEFARLECSADATPAVMLSPAVAMTAEVHYQRPLAGTDTGLQRAVATLPWQPSGAT